MRRIALALATVGIIGGGIAAALPAQAHETWRGDHPRYEQVRHHEWREHHHWRYARVERHVPFEIFYR